MSENEGAPPTGGDTTSGEGLAKSLGLTDALKKGIADYISTHDVKATSGELNVDLEFMKNHAGPLLAHLLKSATQTLMPKDLRFSVPTPPPSDKPDAPPVQVNFDLGDFLSKLFNPPSTNPPR